MNSPGSAGFRARHTTVAVAAAVVLGTGLGPLVPPATASADPAGPSEAVFPAGARWTPRTETLYTAGATGFMHTREGGGGAFLWTDYASGETTTVPVMSLLNTGLLGVPSTTGLTVTDLATGARVTTARPTGQSWAGAFTSAEALTYEKSAEGTITALHLLRTAGGEPADVRLPADALPSGATSVRTVAQDLRGAVLELTGAPSGKRLLLVDYAEGAVTELFGSLATTPTRFALSAGRVLGWYGSAGAARAFVVPRGDAAATPSEVEIPPLEGASAQPAVTLGLAGEWVVVARARDTLRQRPGETLTAVPLNGGQARTLLTYATSQVATAPDGSVLVVGGTGAGDWAVRRVADAGAEGPAVSEVLPVEPVAARVDGLALGAGRLSVVAVADGSPQRSLYESDLAPTGFPVPGSRVLRFRMNDWYTPCQTGSACIELHARGNGRTAYATGGYSVDSPIDTTTLSSVGLPSQRNRLGDSSGRYTVITDADTPSRQYVGDFEQHHEQNVALTRSATAASVWGTTLWKPGSAKGTVNALDLKTRKTSADVNLGSGCVPQELQAAGRWLYWSCGPGGKAGVWDGKTKKSIAVPSGEALVGDGFLVRHDRDAGKLLLTDFHDGATAVTGEFAELSAGDADFGRRVGWTVDKYGGGVAYVDGEQRIHVKQVTVPRSPITAIEATTDDYTHLGWPSEAQNIWHGTWLLSRPPVGWTLSFRDVAGKTVRTIRGTAHESAQIATTWNGRDDRGAVVVGGRYTWSLTADPGDGSGFRTVGSGAMQLAGAKSAWRDFDGDGTGELVGLTTSGTLRHLAFDLDGGVTLSGSKGWNTGYRFVPFGDLDGDGCADTLVRTTSGALYRYSGGCKGSVATTAPKLSLGTGFQAYDVLTSPGDLSGDGRPDLVVRKTSTSDVWLYKATSSGRLAARVKLASKWTGYKKIVGAGDLNGDGFGDLLVQDKANVLWRYNGDGKGHLKPRVKLASKWGADYNVVAGAGDITADGRMDLLVRDTKNRVWLYKGNGKGAFGARTLLTDGVSGYKTLS